MVESRMHGLSGTSTPIAIGQGGQYTPYSLEDHLVDSISSRVEYQETGTSPGSDKTLPRDSIPSRPASARECSSTFHRDVDATYTFPQPTPELIRSNIDGATTPPGSMPGDASSTSTPVRNRSRANNRRRPFNAGGLSRSAAPPMQPTPAGFFPSPGSSNDSSNTQSFQQPGIHFASPPLPFDQRSGFYGQYTAPSQPPSLPIGQSHPTYPYRPPFHSSQHPDGPVSSPQHHFPQHLSPNPSHYHFPRHPSDDGTGPPPSFSARNPAPSRFQHHQGPGGASRPSTEGPSAAMTPVYVGSPHFQQMGFSSSSQYGYPAQYSSPPQLYQSYGPIPHYQSSPREGEPPSTQGSWYFVPHSPPPAQPSPYEYRPNYSYQYIGQQHDPHAHVPAAPSIATPQQSWPPDSVMATASPPLPRSAPSSIGGRDSPASSLQNSSSSKPVVRREWHPRPPARRSPWVMWVGNVPSDATQEELWSFFTRNPATGASDNAMDVESIFLIARSNCAFINYNGEDSVKQAIQTFNGKSLRPSDPQCPLLVCKIRKSADDLKSGVGGQRGIGLHKQWVQEQMLLGKRLQGSESDFEVSDDQSSGGPESLVDGLGSLSISSQGRRKGAHTSSTSSSHASTTSSFLAEYFPIRFFILKSLSEEDLDISVRNGLWATQKHNELLLDQAFRTAKDVFLIFSVNKSGEFYGYARMIGPIRHGEASVAWTARSDEGSSSHASSPDGHRKTISGIQALEATQYYFTPDGEHVVDASPLQITDLHITRPKPAIRDHFPSAPSKLGGITSEGIRPSPYVPSSLQHVAPPPAEPFKLDPNAPKRAIRSETDRAEPEAAPSESKGKAKEEVIPDGKVDGEGAVVEEPAAPGWGDCFKVEWLERRKLPFHRCRHLRNPWNKGREIKISRDGTELEPSVGKKFVEEWESLVGETVPASP